MHCGVCKGALCTKKHGSLCVFLLVWEIKLNLKSVIVVVWKEGREGALILQVDGDFFYFYFIFLP